MNGSKNHRERIGNILLTLALVALAAAVGSLLVEHRLTLVSETAFGVAGALLLAFVIVEPTRTRTWVTSRQVRYGSNAVMMTMVLLAILGVGNFLADRHPYRVDVTADRSLSLAPQTVDVLNTLEGPVRIVGFFTSPTARDRAADLLDQYRYHYPDLMVEFHDPAVEYSQALEWEVTETWRPTLFILYQERKEKVHVVSEREITSALVRLTRETQPVVYFLTGHGERDLEDPGDAGLSTLRERLQEEGFQVAPLNLLVTATVPSDASAVVAVGPQRPLSQDEVGRLAEYVDGGGAAMILLDPAPNPDMEPSALADWLSDRWGVAFREDLVIDPASFIYPMPTVPVAVSYGNSPVGRGMDGTGTYFIETRSIAHITVTQETTPTVTSSPDFISLVETSADSWGETSWEQLAKIPDAWPQYDEEEDMQGPLAIAATLEEPESGARLALFGDSHFCANMAVRDLANGDLFINTLNWLTEDEELISLRPQSDVDRYVSIRSNLIRNGIFVVLVILIPLAVLGVGVVVLLARRARQ
ncbi:MAG TPA: hypothetical protein ENI37_05470 [Chloroflexi bacterium]|nr:hypothetical protein [Chloroflexota bacterium]